jgi:hypothetical protein
MKTLVKTLFLCCILIGLQACEKEELLTSQEKIENDLQEIIDGKKITKCTIREIFGETYYDVAVESTFTLKNGFIIVDNTLISNVPYSYNLNYLYNYRITTNNVLLMEFLKN